MFRNLPYANLAAIVPDFGYLQQLPLRQVAHQGPRSEGPGRRSIGGGDDVNERSQILSSDRDHVALVVSEALAGHVAILNRSEHSAEEKRRSVGVLMVWTDHLIDECHWITAYPGQVALTLKAETILAFNQQGHLGVTHIVEGEGAIEQANEWPDRRRSIVILGLAK